MIYFAIYPPATKHPDEWTIYKLRLNKCLHKDSLLLKLINLDNLTHTASFLPAFLHREITWSSKLRILPILFQVLFVLHFSNFFHTPFQPRHFHTYVPKLKGDICLCWVSCCWFQTIHLLKKGRALIFWSDCLDHCRKHETLCHLQDYKLL